MTTIAAQPTTIPLHPYATLFPPMSAEQYEALRDSIELRGQREPIRLYAGEVLDGRHRLLACEELGREPLTADLPEDDDPLEYVLDLNADRRDLSATQRAMIAARLSADSVQGGDRGGNQYAEWHRTNLYDAMSTDIAAKRLGVGTTTVAAARRLLQSEEADLIAQCDAGEVAVSKAVLILDERQKAKADAEAKLAAEREQAEAKLAAERAALDAERERLQAEAAAKAEAERAAAAQAEADRQARRERERAAAERRAEAMGTPARDDVALHHCPVSELWKIVGEESVDIVFADPPYELAGSGAYRELTDFAAHALKPGGILLAMTGQYYLPEVLYDLTTNGAIEYVWTIAYNMPGGSVMSNAARAHCNWKPLVLLCKGEYAGEWYADRITVPTLQQQEADLHQWQQQEAGITEALSKWATPGLLVCDPFLGSGTTGVAARALGCGFIGADSAEDCIATARERLGLI